jgi:hypothetical protein
LKKAIGGISSAITPRMQDQKKNAETAVDGVKSPRSEKKEKIRSPEDAIRFTDELIDRDKPENLSCFSVDALVQFKDGDESGNLREAEAFLRAFRIKINDNRSPMTLNQDISLKDAIDQLSKEPFSNLPQLDNARNALGVVKGQGISPEKGMRTLEAAIEEVAAARNPQYGRDLHSVNGLIRARDYIATGIAGTLSCEASLEDLHSGYLATLRFLKSSVPKSVQESVEYMGYLKGFSDRCNLSDQDKDRDNRNKYKKALCTLHRDLRFCFPPGMNTECSMSPTERQVWVDIALQMLAGPVRGVSNKKALNKAYAAIKEKDKNALNTEHAILSGSFRMVGLYTLAVKTLAKNLPSSEHSNVKVALEKLQEATTRHNAVIKRYAGAESCSSEAAMQSFDEDEYDAIVTELRALSVELFRSVGLTNRDVEAFVQVQNESKNTDKNRVIEDEKVLRSLLDELQ